MTVLRSPVLLARQGWQVVRHASLLVVVLLVLRFSFTPDYLNTHTNTNTNTNTVIFTSASSDDADLPFRIKDSECGERYRPNVHAFMKKQEPFLYSQPLLIKDPPTTTTTTTGKGKVALLVEPRKDPCIGFAVFNIMHYLSKSTTTTTESDPKSDFKTETETETEWALQIYHGGDNLEYTRHSIAQRLVKYQSETYASLSDALAFVDSKIVFTDLSTTSMLPPFCW